MSAISRKKTVFIAGLILILIVIVSVSRNKDKLLPEENIDVSFSEEDLGSLGEALESLDFEDLEGFTGEDDYYVGFSLEDLENLGSALEGLEFEDLGGLSES